VENQAPYHVAFVATPPATSLTYEQFSEQARAQVLAYGSQYLTDTLTSHRPAHTRGTVEVQALTTYTAQVWDLAQATSTKTLGQFCFSAEAETPAACLLVLAAKLRDHEQVTYEADPTRLGEQLCEMYQELAAYDYAA